jgi:tripartite-type tricarboxylate transporter receptor subunit TctC
MKIVISAAVAAVLFMALAGHTPAQTDFYKGKTITVVQIVGAGGSGDMRRRALFPYLQKYIPGNPTIVSEYMPGAGGRKAANHVYRVARPDGLTIGGMSSSLVTNAILDTGGVQYDMDKFIYLGSPVSIFHYIFLTRREAGLSNLEKLRAATGVRIGAQEVGHDVYITGRLFAYMLGLRDPRFVTGYGGPEIDIALARGELDGRANALETLERAKRRGDEKEAARSSRGRRNPERSPAEWLCPVARIRKLREIRSRTKGAGDVPRFQASRHTVRLRSGNAQAAGANSSGRHEESASTIPTFHQDFKKLSGFDASPLMPEEQEKVVRELPRDQRGRTFQETYRAEIRCRGDERKRKITGQ